MKDTVTTSPPTTPTRPGPRGPELEKFGQRVRRMREDAGLSQSELARRSGIDRPSLHRLEAGRLDIGVSRLVALARALDCTPGELFEPAAARPTSH